MSGLSRALSSLVAIPLAMAAATAGAADKYQVIVHWTNSLSTLKTEVVAAIFLKKAVRWPDGREVVPIDQSLHSPVREAFTREVLRESILGVESYWRQQIAAGRRPPLAKGSDDEVQTSVAQNAAAIGYVSGETKLIGTVKALKLVR